MSKKLKNIHPAKYF